MISPGEVKQLNSPGGDASFYQEYDLTKIENCDPSLCKLHFEKQGHSPYEQGPHHIVCAPKANGNSAHLQITHPADLPGDVKDHGMLTFKPDEKEVAYKAPCGLCVLHREP